MSIRPHLNLYPHLYSHLFRLAPRHLARLMALMRPRLMYLTAHCQSAVMALPPVFSSPNPAAAYCCPGPPYVLHPAPHLAPHLAMPRRRQTPQTILLPRPATNFAMGFATGFGPNSELDFAAMFPQRLVAAADSVKTPDFAAAFLRMAQMTAHLFAVSRPPAPAMILAMVPATILAARFAMSPAWRASVTTHQTMCPLPEAVRLQKKVAVARCLGLSALLACLAATLVNQNQT